MRDKFNILIQGPLNNTSLSNLDNYKKFGDVVISHWEEDEEGVLIDSIELRNIKRTMNKLPIDKKQKARDVGHICLGGNDTDTFYYALSSIYNGCLECDKPYVIKVRSDEKYTNLQPMVDKFLENTDRVICGNAFYKPQRPFHMGDHMYVIKRDTLLKACKTLIDGYILDVLPENLRWISRNNSPDGYHYPESILARSILESSGYSWREISHYDKIFEVVNINTLGDYIVCHGHLGLVWDSSKGNILKEEDYL